MRQKSLRYFYIAAVLLFFGNLLGSCLVFLQVHNTTHFYFVNPIPYLRRSNFECYKTRTQNTANITSPNFFSRKSIFFHSLWCDKIINEAGACAIESAARLHPEMSINLIFACPVSHETWSRHLDVLIKLPNFRMVGMQIEGYANGTEFEKIWRSLIANDKITDSKDITEYVKFLTLHRFGGVVLDLDVIVNKPLDTFGGNWIVMNDEWTLSTDAISIQLNNAGHNVTTFALRHLSRQILQKKINASIALESALIELCPNHNFTEFDSEKCYAAFFRERITNGQTVHLVLSDPLARRDVSGDVSVVSLENWIEQLTDFSTVNELLIHPISRENWKHYYLPGPYDSEAFAHRLWDDQHPDMAISRHTLYGGLAKAFCPWVYNGIHEVL